MGKPHLDELPGAANTRWWIYFVAGALVLLAPILFGLADGSPAVTNLRVLCAALFFLCGALSRQIGRLESHVREVASLVNGLAVRTYGANYYAERNTVTWLIDVLATCPPSLQSDVVAALQEVTGKTFGNDVEAWRLWWEAARSTFQREEQG